MPKHNCVLNHQARKIIYDLTQYFKKEKEDGVKDVDKVYLRVSNATGVSQRTIQRIVTEGKLAGSLSEFRTPGKKRARSKPITDMDSLDQGVMKRYIHNFHKSEKQMPTIHRLLAKLRQDNTIHFQGAKTSLKTIVKNLGFKWRKTKGNKMVLIEKTNIRLKRILYLNTIKKCREEGRTIVFTSEAYAYSLQTKSNPWTDGSNDGLKGPIAKGQRIVMMHAGSEAGFVPNGLLIFKSVYKTGETHDMNFSSYKKWLETQLIPNLSPNSVVVLHNAPYQNKVLDPTPTSNDKKSKMESWLAEKGIPFEKNMRKPQLYDLIKKHKDVHKRYVVDEMFKQKNHDVLRLPPYHPDLNPLEMAWVAVKEYVAEKNVDGNVNKTMELIQEKVKAIGQEEWSLFYRKLHDVEEEYRQSDHIIDEMTEQFGVNIGSDSESETESESEEDDEDEPMPSTSRNTQGADESMFSGMFPLSGGD
ncbi:hypothetical protein PYW08_010641 [Mythimna loreyi]|uniref:Uncharacterized protein n=1 Tax=Mythimna loreyi TaxID=667449 RepID=A0ACC2Q3R8_9NEOP|nr:hypothetical protein PYW08_010641 [Mythimna loreyi]